MSCDLHLWFRGWWSGPTLGNSFRWKCPTRKGRGANAGGEDFEKSCVLMKPCIHIVICFVTFKHCLLSRIVELGGGGFNLFFFVSPRSLGKWSNFDERHVSKEKNTNQGKVQMFFCWISDLYFRWSFLSGFTDGRSWPSPFLPPFLRDKKSTLWEFLESRPGIEAGYGIELSASRRKNGRLGKRLTHWGMLTGVMYLSVEGFVGGLKSQKEWNIVESFLWAALLCCC